jgi:hypothetical protein
MLQHWTERGRVRPDDYLVSLDPELCIQARDVVELDAIFRRTRARLLGRVWPALACAAFLLAWIAPLFWAGIFVSAIAIATACHRAARRPHYSLSSHLRERGAADCDLAQTRLA